MNVNSIDKFSETSSSRERLKYWGQSVHDRHVAESNVGSQESYKGISGRVMNESNSAAFSFKGRTSFLGKEWVGKVLKYADEHNQTANALISFVMAGILRPLFTMQLKVDEKKDKILATFHSICSAVLGLAVSVGITQPIDVAVKKAINTPELYKDAGKNNKGILNDTIINIDKKIAEYKKIGGNASLEKIKHLTNKKEAIALVSKNFPEWLICIPRAMLTVALIPVFMKGITNIRNKMNKKRENAEQKATVTSAETTNKIKDDTKKQDVSFKGKAYDKLTDAIAKKLVIPFMNSKTVNKIAERFADNLNFIYDTIQMVASFAISATYAIRSYKNTKLDDNEKNRKVLALNHFTTWAISTAISLLTLKRLGSWWQRKPMAKLISERVGFVSDAAKKEFREGYKQIQAKKLEDAKKTPGFFNRYKAKNDARKYSAREYFMDKYPDMEISEDLGKMLKGLDILQRQLVWGSVTRLLVPLCSTIIASKIGRKIINKREAKQEALRQNQIQNQQVENLIKDVEIEECAEA